MTRGLIASALVCALALCACERGPAEGAAAPTIGEAPAADSKTAAVETRLVQWGNVPVVISASGTIAARRVTEVVPEVAGQLVEVRVDVGDEVEKGDLLFRIDATPYALAVTGSRAGLALALAQAENATNEAERVSRLAEERAASEQRVEALRTQASVAQARVEQARAQLAHARRDLKLTSVLAPYSGSIVERRAHEGAMAGRTPVVVIQESGALEAVLDIPEASSAPVRKEDAVRLFVEGLADPLESQVSAVSRRVDPDTRTYEVRAPVTDSSGTVKAGSYARAEIEPAPGDAAAVIDRSALLMRDGRTYAFRVVGERVERVAVRIGRRDELRAEVTSGLRVGDEVVVGEPVGHLSDGARIRGAGPAVSAALPAPARP